MVLHNSFELISEACDLPNGDALMEEQELSMHSADVTAEPVLEVSRGTACLEPENETMSSIARDHMASLQSVNSQVLFPIKLAVPITSIDENLGPDKRKVQAYGGSNNHTAASLKSVKILSKFWGDMVDDDTATDSTMEPDFDTEKQVAAMKTHIDAKKYLAKQYEMASQIKPSRKTKKQKSPRNQVGTSSAGIRTRSKKGQNSSISPCVGCEN